MRLKVSDWDTFTYYFEIVREGLSATMVGTSAAA